MPISKKELMQTARSVAALAGAGIAGPAFASSLVPSLPVTLP
jgi:hypothetical protein